MEKIFTDDYFMKQALQEAEKAFEADEIPVGAVIVSDGRIIAKAHNSVERLNDVTAHAEMLALTSAFNHLGSKYLPKCTLYVTLEPCVMCAGAMFWSQLGILKYGTRDEKNGFSTYDSRFMHPKTTIQSGIRQSECAELIREFFQQKRSL